MDKPIFDHGRMLTIGYEYPNLKMAESYNAPGSPYWGFKIFACLTLLAEDDFWKTDILTLPKMEKTKSFSEAKLVVQRREDGHAVLFPLGLQIGHVHKHMEKNIPSLLIQADTASA